MPDAALYLQCLQFFSGNMPQARGVRLVVQPMTNMELAPFLEQHYSLFLTILQQQHPTIYGWMHNSYWKQDGDQLIIYIAQEIGLRFLQNQNFTLQASILLDEMIGHRYQVVLACDDTIEKPDLKPRTSQVV